MAIGEVYRLSVIGSNQGIGELVNVHHYRQISGTDDPAGVELIDAWHSNCGPEMLACLNAGILLVGYEVRNLDRPEFGTDYSLPVAETGDQVGEMLPPSVSGVVSWRSGLIGRRRRGRTFMWPFSESAQNAGQINPTQQGLMSTFGIVCLSVAGVNSYQKVIYSPPTEEEPTLLVTDVTSAVVDVILGQQRRRRVGVGS